MPDFSISVLITLVAMIFTAGITWGVSKSKQKVQDDRQAEIIKELKAIVAELRALTTELSVMKAGNVRIERDIENHEDRISQLERAMAKLQATL